MSLESETVLRTGVKPFALAALTAMFAWNSEFASEPVYMTATVFAFGKSCFNNFICSATGVKSLAPVTLVPGFLFDLTNLALAGSVTAETTTGMSLVFFAIA